jgi:hypothetical protein
VQISYGDSEVRVTVTNTAAVGRSPGALASPDAGLAGPGNGLAATGSGLGIAGLRQRIELVNGTLRAGPAQDGGFRLEATLPAYVRTAEPAA